MDDVIAQGHWKFSYSKNDYVIDQWRAYKHWTKNEVFHLLKNF